MSTINANKLKGINQRLDELVNQVSSIENNAELAINAAEQNTADLHLIREDLSRNLNPSPVPSPGVASVAFSHRSASTDVLPRGNLFSELATASPDYGARVVFGEVSGMVSIVLSQLTRTKDSPVDQLFLENNRSDSSSLVSSPSPSPRLLRDNIDVDFPPINPAAPSTSSHGLSRVAHVYRGKSTANGAFLNSQHPGAQSAYADSHPGPSRVAEQGTDWGSLGVVTNILESPEEPVSYTPSTSPSHPSHTQQSLAVEGSPIPEVTDFSSRSSESNSQDDFTTTESLSTSESPLMLPHVPLPVAPPLVSLLQPLLPHDALSNSNPSWSLASSELHSDTQPNETSLNISTSQPSSQPANELLLRLPLPTWSGLWSYVTTFCLDFCQKVRATVCHTILCNTNVNVLIHSYYMMPFRELATP
jgi:hypothetical protein